MGSLKGLVLICLIFAVTVVGYLSWNLPLEKKEPTLRVLVSEKISSLNPFSQSQPLLWKLKPLVFQSLIRRDLATGMWKPVLAEAWRWDSENKKMIFDLNPKAHWQDGKPVTATDVFFSINLHSKLKSKSIYYGTLDHILEKVEVLSPTQVSIQTQAPTYYDWMTFGQDLLIYPAHYYSQEDGSAKGGNKWLGSGEYKWKSFEPDQSVAFQRDSTAWDKKGETKDLELLQVEFVTSLESRVEQVKSGIAEWADLSWREALRLRKEGRAQELLYTQDLGGEAGELWILLNHKNSHLAQPEVRRALMWSLNRESINQKLFGNELVLASGYWPTSHPYAFSGREKQIYQPEKARILLQSLGYWDKDHNGILENSKGELSFSVLTFRQEDEALLDLLQKDLRAVGVRLLIEKKGMDESFRRISEGQYDAYLMELPRFYSDLNLRHQFHSARKNAQPILRFSPKAQILLDKKIEELEMQENPEVRKVLMQELDEILAKELPHLFLFEMPHQYWLRSKELPSNSYPPF